MTDQGGVPIKNAELPGQQYLSRRGFIAASTGLAGSVVATGAAAGTLADVPPREPGADFSAHSERSRYVQLNRIPEAGPGNRNVDPGDAINSKTPLQKLVGGITPSDLHYERSHSGAPDLDPAKHRFLVHGMVQKPLVLTVDDIKAMPSISRVVFIECTGNGWENWKKADPDVTVQNTHGLVSTNEWTGVPLKFLIDLVGKDSGSSWMLAEGGDAAGVARSIPLTDEIVNEAFVAYGQNGEPLRPAHGFPMRLVMPGLEGNLNIKWLRRLKFGDQPWMTRWETARYTQLLANGKARQFQLRMETNSVITSPSGMMEIRPGYNRITGLAWSGHGKIATVEVSTDGAKSWKPAQLNHPVLPKHRSAIRPIGIGTASPPRSSVAPPTRRAMFSRTATPSSRKWGRTRCSTTTRNKPGTSTRPGEYAMRSPNKVVASLVVTVALMSPVLAYDFGRRATPEEIKLWDIDVRPDGKGLPEGSGTVVHGKQVFEENCSACHGEAGQGGIKDRLVGGQGTLASDMPVKTVGSFWPYATTLFDYVHRAMPYQAPGSLSVDDTYAVVAYILSLNGIASADGKLDKASLPLVKMPNRDGFIPEAEFGPSRQPGKK